MRKLTITASTVAAIITLSACQPAAKEEPAAPETTEAPTAATEASPMAEVPATEDAAKAGETMDPAADNTAAKPGEAGTEHTGGIKVKQ